MGWSFRVLRAGAFKLDAGAMFGLVPKPLWSRVCETDERNRVDLQTNCLLLEQDGTLALIEAGIGDKSDAKTRDIFAIEDRCVLDALREVDCDPADISTVVLTHLHFDHAGGVTRRDDAGGLQRSFPNAEIVVQKQEWEDALANKSVMHSTYLREHLDPIRECVRTVEGAADVLTGVRVEPAPGHTWGQQAVFFEDDRGRTVVFPGDLMPTRMHVGLTYNMAYDMLPYENMLQKKRFLERASAEKWIIAMDHDPGDPLVMAEARGDRPGAFTLTSAGG